MTFLHFAWVEDHFHYEKMYCGHAHLCVCPQPHAHTIARTRV